MPERIEAEIISSWGFDPQIGACERCNWSFLFPKGSRPELCPHCFEAPLSHLDEPVGQLASQLASLRPPEKLIPFSLPDAGMKNSIETFARGIPFAPLDLTPQNLAARLRRVYLPRWLVDVDVQANWSAEVGFNYEVVSHQDRYDERHGGWNSQQVQERRVRWEPRAGRLNRTYTNLPTPALEKEAALKHSLGDFASQNAQPYASAAVTEAAAPAAASGDGKAAVRLPNRSIKDAWTEAVPAVEAAAAEECRLAAGADHLRQFQWSPQFNRQEWTLLLLPAYSTYYLDDDHVPQSVLIHGQSGRVSGKRRSSPKRAQRVSWLILAAALVVFLASLLLAAGSVLAPPLLVVGGLGILLALIIALGAAIPVLQVWQFNRSRDSSL